MKDRRRSLRLTPDEITALLDVTSKELIKQITHHAIDPSLASLVTKAARTLSPDGKNQAAPTT